MRSSGLSSFVKICSNLYQLGKDTGLHLNEHKQYHGAEIEYHVGCHRCEISPFLIHIGAKQGKAEKRGYAAQIIVGRSKYDSGQKCCKAPWHSWEKQFIIQKVSEYIFLYKGSEYYDNEK